MADQNTENQEIINKTPFNQLTPTNQVWALLLAEIGPSNQKGSQMDLDTGIEISNKSGGKQLTEEESKELRKKYKELIGSIDSETKGKLHEKPVVEKIKNDKYRELSFIPDDIEISGLIADYYMALIDDSDE